jgi:hypothetical protein
MTAPIQMLWVEGPLSALERLSISSFLHCGHRVHLYVYGRVDGIPDGVEVLDGRSILPEERICRYGAIAGEGKGSLALFANLFRYALLHRHGGVWSDCDVICLKSLDAVLAADYVIATEYRDGARQMLLANNCFLKTPPASPFAAECSAIALGADPDKVGWGELGPVMVTNMVRKHGLERFLVPPWQLSPLGWWEYRRLIEETTLPCADTALAVHCFNEMWRRSSLDKNARYAAHTPFELLKQRYLPEGPEPAAVAVAPSTRADP